MTTSGTGKARDWQASGFTLVELVIAITVLAILGGLAVPAIDSVQRERLAREPVNQLYLLAREVRVRSMKERRPYQIVFDREGFRASRFFQPYGGSEEFEALRTELEQRAREQEMIDASRARGIDLSAEKVNLKQIEIEEGLQYFREYEWSDDVECSLRFWDEMQWVGLSSGEFRRWIFQPSGMCEPLRLRIEADGAYFEIEFHPLTADIKSERSWVE
ncbi:prepilin-type N-terminal cleavage/methylation domain-containing protein [Verrucomicrobiales bacterium]|jgi:prepilin-type N-terminal cleavage/methylation domain-containing protein|nr:prepilin-type N-terminal cleavage/methylation domain-containing protein [Verrucomicrobiales bacterium]